MRLLGEFTNDMLAPLSIRPDCPIDGIQLAILCGVREACLATEIDYLVAGATARDLILFHVHGRRIRRRTQDIDIGIAIPSWSEFQRLKDALTAQPCFVTGEVPHAVYYAAAPDMIPFRIDIIPFGGVENEGGQILWPPSGDTVMGVRGFDVALAHSVLIQLPENGLVRSASLAGLVLLKLFAWLDRGKFTGVAKDALDLAVILVEYADAGQLDRLYGERNDLMVATDYDVTSAGALLLADDVRSITPTGLLDELYRELVQEDALDHIQNQIALKQLRAGREVEEIEETRLLRRFWGRLFDSM